MKDIEQLFLQKVSESGKEGHRHNLADDVDFQYTMNLFGGEELLKKNFPGVYEMLCATKAHHEEMQEKNLEPLNAAAANGFDNSSKVRYVSLDPTKDLATASSIHRTNENLQLMIVSQVRDVTNNKALDGFAIQESNTTFLEGVVKQPNKTLVQSTKREYKVSSSFVWVSGHDASGKPIFDVLTVDVDALKMLENTFIVNNITINDPHTIRNPQSPNTKIIYDRQHIVGEKYDYAYPLIKTGNQVRMKIPFNGSVTFNPLYKPTGVRKDTFRLMLEHKNFGTIQFNKNAWNKIKWTIKDNVISWAFPEDWETTVNIAFFPASGIGFQFYCEMEIDVNFGGVPFPIPIYVVISSEDLAHDDPSYKKIKPIDIYWGCLGKDTQVRMADQSYKTISDIRIGEMILDANGKSVQVVDIMTGIEERMILVESEDGKSILLTDSHPILTERGMVLAKNLNASDILIMENGSKSALRYVYIHEYNDQVYSLVFEKSTNLIGNGFIVGDFETQNEVMAQAAIIESAKKPLLGFQKEIRDLVAILDAKLKQPE